MADEGVVITSDMAEQFIGSQAGTDTTDGMALAAMLVEAEEERRALKARLEQVSANMDALKAKLLDVFTQFGVNNLSVGGMTVYMTQQIAAKVVGDRQAAVQAVKDWAPECVTENFNLNTLSALMREQMQKGGFTDPQDLLAELPASLTEHLTVSDWYDVRIRKS